MGDTKEQLTDIVKPHEHDVLSGRGNYVNHHAGNENFRKLVRSHKVAYVACPKAQKAIYSKIIYDEIRAMNPPGRFLRQDPKSKLWSDIGEKKALDKTRQALREGAPELLKDIESGEVDGVGGGKNEVGISGENAPLRASRQLNDSLFSQISLGSFLEPGSLANSFTTAGFANSFTGANQQQGGIPQSIGNDGGGNNNNNVGSGGMDNNVFGPGVTADQILAAAAQIQAQQQALQQHDIQQQRLQQQQRMQQQQHQPNNLNLEAQLQLMKAMQNNMNNMNNSQQSQQGGGIMGNNNNMNNNNMNMGNSNMGNAGITNNQQQRNVDAILAAAQQAVQQSNNNNGIGSIGGNNDVSALLAAIHGSAIGGLNNNNMGNNNTTYEQQLAIHQDRKMGNNNNQCEGGNDSQSTLMTGNLSNEITFGDNASNINTSSFGTVASQQVQHHGNDQQQFQGGYQFDSSVTLKQPKPMPSMKEENPSTFNNTNAGRRPGNMRGSGGGGELNSSFTRAQRIGQKNQSSAYGRRPNRRIHNVEFHNSLKNSLMSIESLTLSDIDGTDMDGVFDNFGEITEQKEDGEKKVKGGQDEPHDMSEVSLVGEKEG